VFAGGAVGALARVGLTTVLPGPIDGWPWATMVANLTGALLLGFLLGLLRDVPGVDWAKPLLGTGVLGGYTTFSTLSVEALLLADQGRPGTALSYATVTAIAGLLAAWLGTVGALGMRRTSWGGR
jgi:CrcB protein